MKSKMWIVGFIAFLAVTALPSAAQDKSAVTLPEDIPDYWGSGGRSVGWEFTPTQEIVVTQLGLGMALNDTLLENEHTVTLYQAGNALVDAVFSGTQSYADGGYAYTPVAGPTLSAGTTYVIAVWAANVQGDRQIGSVDGEQFDEMITPLRLNLYSDFSGTPVMPGNELSGKEFLSASFKFTPTTTPVIQVDIDVKPGSFPNSVNINGNGVIPVAILGSADFDVSQVDPATLIFAGLEVNVRGKDKLQVSIDDVAGPDNGPADGYPDLVVHFADDPTLWTVGEDNDAVLDGALLDGTPIQGTDSVRVVP